MKSKYFELLQDPQWQRRRLDIFNRDGFKCVRCGDSKQQLHVHHRYYVSHRKPWEYPDHALATLCKPCHHEFSQPEMCLQENFWELSLGVIMSDGAGSAYEFACRVNELANTLGTSNSEIIKRLNALLGEAVSVGELPTLFPCVSEP